MLDEQLIRDLNNTLNRLTGEIGGVKSTLKQNEKTFVEINKEILKLNENISKNNITIAKATGFVGGLSFIISILTMKGLQYFKFI